MALIPLTNAGAVQLNYSDLAGNPTVNAVDPPVDMSNTSTWQWITAGGTILSTSVPADMSNSSLANGYLEETNVAIIYAILRPVVSGTTTWGISAKAKINALSCPGNNLGFVGWDSAGNKMITIFFYQNGEMNNNQQLIYVRTYSATGGFFTTVQSTLIDGVGCGNRMDVWLKMSSDGTTMTLATSADGANWHTITTYALATYVSPTHYGFYSNTGGNTSGAFLAATWSNGTFS